MIFCFLLWVKIHHESILGGVCLCQISQRNIKNDQFLLNEYIIILEHDNVRLIHYPVQQMVNTL